ncbi:hypothetical protein BDZ97DRAFT_1977654 [Flammula alnicola]|nr:hypothetical protein BDZ97DRAFT_1977654 [Flammula alnicola]
MPAIPSTSATPAIEVPSVEGIPPADLPNVGTIVHFGGSNFRWSIKKCFLTYSQVGDRPFAEVTVLMDKLKPKPVKWFAVQEFHEDGGCHWHVLVCWDKVFRSRSSRAMDIDGIHPHVRTLPTEHNMDKVIQYMRKTPGALTMGNWVPPLVQEHIGTKKEVWSYINNASTEEEFWARIRIHAPYEETNNYHNLLFCCQVRYKHEKKQTFQSDYQPGDFPHITSAMKNWYERYIKSENPGKRPKALVIWGPSRTGKTEWARSLGHHIYFNSIFNLDQFDEGAEYVIFDDYDPKNFTNYKCWFGGQAEFNLTDKYTRKRTVKWGKPMIWLSNANPLEDPVFDSDWLAANTVVVHLDSKLFDEPEVPF